MRQYVLIIICLLSLSAIASAYDLPSSPIHTQLKYDLQLAANDEFDNLNKNENDESDKKDMSVSKTTGSDERPKNISIVKSALYSALLPGLGEYKLGHKSKAKVFFAAEAVSWIGFAAFKIYGNWKEDDMIKFAAQRANAQLDGKDDDFLDFVGFYESTEQYNTLGRVSDRDRPYYQDTPEYHWYWQNEADQRAYRDIKNASRSADRKAQFMVGLAVFNRIVAVIDTIRDAKREKNKIHHGFSNEKKFDYKFTVNPLSTSKQIKLTLYTPF